MAFTFQVGSAGSSQFIIFNGTAYAVGRNTWGQLGLNDDVDRSTLTVLSGADWKQFSSGVFWSAAVTNDGKLYTCGDGASNRLGYTEAFQKEVFTQVGVATDWASVACGQASGYGINTAQKLLVWGSNGSGELGLGTTVQQNTPALSTSISGLTLSKVVAGGNPFAVVLTTLGKLYGAGFNAAGQLGLGHTTSPITNFTQIGTSTLWVDVSCGDDFCMGIQDNAGARTLWAWGYNASYRLGLNDTTTRTSPVQVGVATNWTSVRCGTASTYAIQADGSIWSWGYGLEGELVQGDYTSRPVPTKIGVATWTSIGVCSGNLFAVSGGTTLYVGGNNQYGTLGMGDVTTRLSVTANPFVFAITEAVLDVMSSSDLFGYVTHPNNSLSDSASMLDSAISDVATILIETIGLADSSATTSLTAGSLVDSAVVADTVQQAIEQLVAELAAGIDAPNIGIALALVDIALAAETQESTYNSVMLVAELVAALEALNTVGSEDIIEAGVVSDSHVARIYAIAAMLEAALISDTADGLLRIYQVASDTGMATDTIGSEGSILNALLSEGALATIRLNIGGELFTGWVLNTDTLAPSEYQFADRQFNSACKHGDRYLMAAEDGVYEFTEDAGVETVMTYIKTGKTDFGSDLRKYIPNSYMVYSASGDMVLKVTTSEFGKLQTRNYRMVPPAGGDTTDTRRFDIGKGIRSRYWQFELAGDGVDCDIDEIGMLPVVLSRRI